MYHLVVIMELSSGAWHLRRTAIAWNVLLTIGPLQDFDLSKGESRDSTTAYGLSFLEQIRRTADKRYGP